MQNQQNVAIDDIPRISNEERLNIARERAQSGDVESIAFVSLNSPETLEREKFAKLGAEHDNPDCLIDHGMYREKKGDTESALKCYSRAAELGWVEAQIMKGILQVNCGPNLMYEGLETLLSIDPKNDKAWGYRYYSIDQFPIDWEQKRFNLYELKAAFSSISWKNYDLLVERAVQLGFIANPIEPDEFKSEIEERFGDRTISFDQRARILLSYQSKN